MDNTVIDQKLAEIKENAKYFDEVAGAVVTEQTAALDNIMMEICDNIVNAEYPPTELIEKYFLELSNCIYFMNERVEKLGIYDALGKIAYKEAYNNNYMNPMLEKAKPTVAELTAYAEGESINEQVTSEIYSRAYKIIKAKIDSAQTMTSTLSKTLSRRMSEQQLSGSQPVGVSATRQILNEMVED